MSYETYHDEIGYEPPKVISAEAKRAIALKIGHEALFS